MDSPKIVRAKFRNLLPELIAAAAIIALLTIIIAFIARKRAIRKA